MDSQPPALPDLGGVPALPPFQEASEEHPIEQEDIELDTWIIEGTDGAPDDITPAKKGTTGKSCDMDLSSIRWMQLINERDPNRSQLLYRS
jgi:hypothetical protein